MLTNIKSKENEHFEVFFGHIKCLENDWIFQC